MTETTNIIRCVVKSVSFPNNAYNITTLNNRLDFVATVAGGAPVVTDFITLTPGYYTTTTIMAAIKTAIDTILAGPTVTFTQNAITFKIGFTTTGLDDIKLYTVNDLATSVLSPFIGNLSFPVGLASGSLSDTPDLYGLTQVFVHSTTVAEGNLVDGDVETHNILAEVPVDVDFGKFVQYESRDDELESINYRSPRKYDSINIKLKDLDNNIVQLNNGVTTIVIKLYYL